MVAGYPYSTKKTPGKIFNYQMNSILFSGLWKKSISLQKEVGYVSLIAWLRSILTVKKKKLDKHYLPRILVGYRS